MLKTYDHVRVREKVDGWERYGGLEAVVREVSDKTSYGNGVDYSLFVRGRGGCAWFNESMLEFVGHNRGDLLNQWEHELEAEKALMRDLDWIFDHGPEVLADPHGASVQALADCLGIGSLWGPHGEGLHYYINAQKTLALANLYLTTKDKAGWLVFAGACKAQIEKARAARLSG